MAALEGVITFKDKWEENNFTCLIYSEDDIQLSLDQRYYISIDLDQLPPGAKEQSCIRLETNSGSMISSSKLLTTNIKDIPYLEWEFMSQEDMEDEDGFSESWKY